MLATLEPAQADAPTTATAFGSGYFEVRPLENLVEVRIDFDGHEADDAETSATIRGFSAPGLEGGTLAELPLGGSKSFAWSYEEADEPGILAGLTYALIRTTRYPDGLLRGQIVRPLVFGADLSPASVEPPAASGAEGFAGVVVDPVARLLSFRADASGFAPATSVTGVTIRRDAPEGADPILATFPAFPVTVGSWRFDAEAESDLLAGRLYVEVATTAFPDGELRGALLAGAPMSCREAAAFPTPTPGRSPTPSPTPFPLETVVPTPEPPSTCLVAPLSGAMGSDSADDRAPRLATDGAGKWIAVWIAESGGNVDAFTARSTDDGATWGAPVRVGNATNTLRESRPTIAFGGGRWMIAVEADAQSATNPGIFLYVSTNDGLSWSLSSPILLRFLTAGSRPATLPSLAFHGSPARWTLTWSGPSGTESDVFAIVSTDGGASWSATATAASGPADTASDERVSLARMPSGKLAAVWERRQPGGDSDVWANIGVVASGGVTWGTARALHPREGAFLSDDRAPSIASDSDGNLVAIWENAGGFEDAVAGPLGTEGDLLVARSLDEGVTWSEPDALRGEFGMDIELDRGVAVASFGENGFFATWEAAGDRSRARLAISRNAGGSWIEDATIWDAAPMAASAGGEAPYALAVVNEGRWTFVGRAVAPFEPPGPATGSDADLFVVHGGICFPTATPTPSERTCRRRIRASSPITRPRSGTLTETDDRRSSRRARPVASSSSDSWRANPSTS